MHLAGAAKYGAASSHRLSGIAHEQVQMIDDAEPEKSMAAIQRFGALTKLANEASQIPMNLMAANKDMIKDMNSGKNEDPAQFLRDVAALLPN